VSGAQPFAFGGAFRSKESSDMNFFSRPAALACAIAVLVAIPMASAHNDNHNKPGPAATNVEPFGQPGSAKNVTRTVEITLTDAMRFIPSTLTFKRGDTVRLHISNAGKLTHEFVLGTKEEIAEHAEMMRQMPDMVHSDASAVRIAPGHAADIVWQFSKAGDFLFACLVPGHWEAGMQGSVTVSVTGPKSR
jgi:uncharacterized cupredoxin-like copper-binding protein